MNLFSLWKEIQEKVFESKLPNQYLNRIKPLNKISKNLGLKNPKVISIIISRVK